MFLVFLLSTAAGFAQSAAPEDMSALNSATGRSEVIDAVPSILEFSDPRNQDISRFQNPASPAIAPDESNREAGRVPASAQTARTFDFLEARPRPSSSIEWSGLIIDSTRFLLFQQAFRVATESDTRAGLSGPFFRDYKDSVLNIHGWNDGDPFFVNYIDHPMEGSVAGFLEVAHDPRFRGAEIGKSPVYWKSRLRAMAFSAAFSLQFEIGPLSEASIGNIQKNNKKAGVVDWIVTPVVGFGWMLGEDALDKYIVRPLELRTSSHVKRILLRGILNPSRSFANIMQGKVPWHRDSRAGVSQF